MAEHNITGKMGEELACVFLKDQGFRIIERNWTFRKYEIDIIFQKNNLLIIGEVKTRSGNYFGEPEVWVTKIKQKNLIKGAEQYILQRNLNLEIRFDIISVILSVKGDPKIHHIEGAFYPTL